MKLNLKQELINKCLNQTISQTDEADWADVRKMQFIPENGDDKLEKMLIRQRLQRSSKDSNSRHPSTPTNAAVVADHTLNTTTQTTASNKSFTLHFGCSHRHASFSVHPVANFKSKPNGDTSKIPVQTYNEEFH